MKQAVHDNINPFIGISFDKKFEFYAVWKHCFRGTLADLMLDDATADSQRKKSLGESSPAFDDQFKSAFVRDIIRVSSIFDLININFFSLAWFNFNCFHRGSNGFIHRL